MRAILLAGVLLAVGCGNEPIQNKKPTELDRWQGEWKSVKESRYLVLKVKGEQVEIDIDPAQRYYFGDELVSKMRLRILPEKDKIGQVDFVHNSFSAYKGIYLWRPNGEIELCLSRLDRPKDFDFSFVIRKSAR